MLEVRFLAKVFGFWIALCSSDFFFLMLSLPPRFILFPYTTLFRSSGRVQQTYKHSVPRFFVPEHGTMFTLALEQRNAAQNEIGRAVQQECRDRSRMPSSA